MPSTLNNTYHEVFSQPEYDNELDRKRYELIREADEVLEIVPPREPTQAEENDYLEFLADDFRSDRWATMRFRKLTPGPKRIPWKNCKELDKQHRSALLYHFFIGAALSWPLGVAIGRRMRVYQGGVPIVPYQRFIHDFPKVEPGR